MRLDHKFFRVRNPRKRVRGTINTTCTWKRCVRCDSVKLPFAGCSVVTDIAGLQNFQDCRISLPAILQSSHPAISAFFEKIVWDEPRLRSLTRATSRQAEACLAEAPQGAEAGNPRHQVAQVSQKPASEFAGGHRSRVTPVPIPNTEVKPATADGTVWETVWESRSLPAVISKPASMGSRAFVCTAAHFPNARTGSRALGCTAAARAPRRRPHDLALQDPLGATSPLSSVKNVFEVRGRVS